MDVFDLAAKITLDKSDYEKGLNEAGSKLQALGGKISSGLKTAAAVGAAAVGAAATAVGGLVVKSVQAYADYEQMVGGVQKLYGNMGMSLEDYAKAQGKTTAEVKDQWQNLEEAQNMVLKNADNAYKTAGMSANKYMEVATSFSASLINSLGGDSKKAAEMTDVAMTAIADNWNTFGGDLGMIQGAFQGFAKQNYTMLDNLKLGYGGTKSEMERLIKDANEYAKSIGQAGDLTIESFADIVSAIDLVQQKQNIAGTTAREASTTISGSLGMVKAAWENLVTGMSNKEADLDTLMNNLVDSVAGYTDKTGKHVNGLIDNIIPVVEKALESVSVLIERLMPKIAQELPKLLSNILPQLLSAGGQIVMALGQGLIDNAPALLEYVGDLLLQVMKTLMEYDFGEAASTMIDNLFNIGEKLDDIWEVGLAIINELFRGLSESAPILMEAGTNIIIALVNDLLDELPMFINTGFTLLSNIAEGIAQSLPDLAEKAVQIIETIGEGIVKNLPMLIEAAVQLITTLVETLTNPDNLTRLLDTGLTIIMTLFEALVDNADELMEAAVTLIENLIQFFSDNVDKVIDTAIEIVTTLVEGLLDNIDLLIDAAIDLIIALAEGLIKALPKLIEKAPVIIEKLVDAIIRNVPKLLVASGEIIVKLLAGIIQALPKLLEAGMEIVNTLQTGIARFLVKLWEAGKEMIEKIGEGLKTINPIEWGKDMIDSFISGIKDRISKVKEAASDIASTVKDILGFSEPKLGPLSDFHSYAPDMVDLFIKGIKDNEKRLQNQVEKTFDFGDMITNPTAMAQQAMLVKEMGKTQTASNSLSGITINVYGAEGQNVNELANAIQDRILHLMNQTGAVYA